MKKLKILFIIGALLLTFSPYRLAVAAEEKKLNPIEQACLELKPKFVIEDEKDRNTFIDDFKHNNESLDATKKMNKMQDAGDEFHRYIGCLFDGMVTAILKVGVSSLPETFDAYTPSLPDLRSPEESCKADPDLRKALLETSPQTLLPVVQGAYDSYYFYMQAILDTAVEKEKGDTQAATDARKQKVTLYFENEMEVAITTINIAFRSMKEMRQAYMIHLQFNCWINHLEGWRNMLEEIRKLVVRLPEKFIDASTTCPAK